MMGIVRLAFGWVFLASCIDKYLHWERFSQALGAYRLVPERLVMVACGVVVALESAIGIALLCGIANSQAAIAGAALLCAFALGMAINLLRGRRNIDCGCAVGAAAQQLEWKLVVRNVASASVLLLAARSAPSDLWPALFPAALGLSLTYLAVGGVWASNSLQRRQLRKV